MSLFTDESTRKKIESINADSRVHAELIQSAINKAALKAQENGEEYQPSAGLVQSLVRNVATANITASMLLCIDNNVPLSDVRNMLNLDGLVESEDPQSTLDELSSIEHLDFSFDPNETNETGEQEG